MITWLDFIRMIISHCDGETCSLSKDLALFLRDMGFKNARVLVNDWTVWQEKGALMMLEKLTKRTNRFRSFIRRSRLNVFGRRKYRRF